MSFRFPVFGSRSGSGFRVPGLGFWVPGFGSVFSFRNSGFGIRVADFGTRVSVEAPAASTSFWVVKCFSPAGGRSPRLERSFSCHSPGSSGESWVRISGLEFRISDFGFWDSGFEFRDSGVEGRNGGIRAYEESYITKYTIVRSVIHHQVYWCRKNMEVHRIEYIRICRYTYEA